ncbi:Uncharacterised protein [Escherichia coli]|uniref:Uncharacterized protein n=1 Tax=Escherichia coli TaxID=562 RepID=A0A376TQZ4_ECOLX|nr:Uncharacterised protein [Escherichia coli]
MQLPNFIQWKNLGAGEYVMGLEVSNSFPDGRDKERAQGRLPFIEPGETKKYCFELGIVDGDAEIGALKAGNCRLPLATAIKNAGQALTGPALITFFAKRDETPRVTNYFS